MHPLFFPIALAFLAAAPSPEARLGQPAPDFTLQRLTERGSAAKDGDGAWSLSSARGSAVVLEWTCHACPAVARAYRGGVPQDTRRALAAENVRWVQIDSSWFAGELADDLRAWRERLGLAEPLLLDPGAGVAAQYGASATPQFFVIDPQGVLVYAGALDDARPEPERENHVLAAARAALRATPAPPRRTTASGCTIKAAQEPGHVVEDIDEELEARRAYRAAAEEARAGRHDEALAALERAIDRAHRRPWETLSDPAFRGLLLDDRARARLRSLLREHPADGQLVLVAPEEPGEAFVLAGTVRDGGGAPLPDALVELYHTDAAGWYAPGTTDAQNPRLFGFLRTDRDGRYRVRTVLPGYYADGRPSEGLQHVHFGVRAQGFRPRTGHRASVYFEDDPNLVGASLREIQGDGCAIRPRTRNAEGTKLCLHDLELQREQP